MSAARPLANLASYALVLAILPSIAPQTLVDPSAFEITSAVQNFGRISALLGIFNLLPGFPLDSGHILRPALGFCMTRAWAALIAGVTGVLIHLRLVLRIVQSTALDSFMGLFLALTSWAEVARNRKRCGPGRSGRLDDIERKQIGALARAEIVVAHDVDPRDAIRHAHRCTRLRNCRPDAAGPAAPIAPHASAHRSHALRLPECARCGRARRSTGA